MNNGSNNDMVIEENNRDLESKKSSIQQTMDHMLNINFEGQVICMKDFKNTSRTQLGLIQPEIID